MHAAVIEAVPAAARRAFAVALQVASAVVGRHVVLAGHVEDAIALDALEHLARRIEFVGFGELRDVARVQDERGTLRKRVELGHGFLQRRRYVLVRVLAEADVAVADLREEDALPLRVIEERNAAPGGRRRGAPREGP